MSGKKSVIITGAAGGIGHATATRFAAEGYNLTLVDINRPALELLVAELHTQYGIEALPLSGDISRINFLELVVANAIAAWGRVDVLVNNAAWRTIETLRTITLENWEKTIRICLTAPAFLAKFCAAHMEEHRIAGVILNISSVMSHRSPGYSPAYVSAKGALESLTHELAVTYGKSNIRVISVSPGFIDTELSKNYSKEDGTDASTLIAADVVEATPLSRPGTPEEVANALCWLASEQASFINGTNLLIDGGLSHNFNDYSIKKIQFPGSF